MSVFNYKKFLSEDHPEIGVYQECFGFKGKLEAEHFYVNDLKKYKTLEYNSGNILTDEEADLFQRLVFASPGIEDYRFEFAKGSLLPDFSFCVTVEDGRFFKVSDITKEQFKKLFKTLIKCQMHAQTFLHLGMDEEAAKDCFQKKKLLYRRRCREYRKMFISQLVNTIDQVD